MTDDKNTLEALLEAAYLWRDSKGEEYGRACSVLWNAVDAHREAMADARPCGMEGYDSPPFECGCGVQFKCVRKDDVFSLEVLRDNGPGTGPREVGHKYPDLQALVDEDKPPKWRRYNLRVGTEPFLGSNNYLGNPADHCYFWTRSTACSPCSMLTTAAHALFGLLMDVPREISLKTPTIEARPNGDNYCTRLVAGDELTYGPFVPASTFEALFEPANRFTFSSEPLLTDADLQEFGTREFKETQKIMQEAYDKERDKRPPTFHIDSDDPMARKIEAKVDEEIGKFMMGKPVDWDALELWVKIWAEAPKGMVPEYHPVDRMPMEYHAASAVLELRQVLGEDAFGRGDTVMSRHDNIRSAHNTVVGRCNNLDDLVEHLEQSLGVESDTVKRLMERVAALEREPSTSMMPEGPKAAVTGPICPCGCYTTEWRDGKDHCSHCGREIVAAVDMGTATRELGSVTVEFNGERVTLMPGDSHTFTGWGTMGIDGNGDVSWTKEER